MFADVVSKQKEYFNEGKTLSYESRIKVLNKLDDVLHQYEQELINALNIDLSKSPYESYLTELYSIYGELRRTKKHLKSYMKVKRARGSIATFPGKSFLVKEPYGLVLVISPWNYPLQLSLIPMISALAAGNTVILKTSSLSVNVSKTLRNMINDNFENGLVYVTNEDSGTVMKERYDYIFFTGGVETGKKVMLEAARNLTPVTLELGGKSPCIVDETAQIDLAAKRIVYGKMLNAGQTCIAPDYVFVSNKVKELLILGLIKYINQFNPSGIAESTYPKIISVKHFNRLVDIINDSKIIYGGKSNIESLKIEMTLLDAPEENGLAMTQEIFGPILPIYGYDDINEVITFVKNREKPLALYLFSSAKATIKKVLNSISFGSGAINNTVLQISNHHLPFGGVGNSGMGAYHGKYGFDTFTHEKPVLQSGNWFDLTLKYPPFTNKSYHKIKKFLK
jgi:aldehyde dehydrogenase (NAD+)